ncbi:MAG TPA: hypothetical protein PLH15_03745 [Spirochaetota bacterium]|nr:hypothetical protein [Spirochaetota bacterium]HQO21954.1 hypothetical protein [Spirochaetota bacterium]HQQ22930.1 hypothetical protein [Spirochaetota bacterium]
MSEKKNADYARALVMEIYSGAIAFLYGHLDTNASHSLGDREIFSMLHF